MDTREIQTGLMNLIVFRAVDTVVEASSGIYMRGDSAPVIDVCISRVEQARDTRIQQSPFNRRLFRTGQNIPIQDTRDATLLHGCLLVVPDTDQIDFHIPAARSCMIIDQDHKRHSTHTLDDLQHRATLL